MSNALALEARPDGEFEIRNVRPGFYDLYPLYVDSTARRFYTSRTPVEVRRDLDGLNLTISPGVSLNGQATIAGTSTTGIKLDALKFTLRPLDTLPAATGVRLKPERDILIKPDLTKSA